LVKVARLDTPRAVCNSYRLLICKDRALTVPSLGTPEINFGLGGIGCGATPLLV
jgi:hypothetical protein